MVIEKAHNDAHMTTLYIYLVTRRLYMYVVKLTKDLMALTILLHECMFWYAKP